MFSLTSVCQSVCSQGGSHVTTTHNVIGPSLPHGDPPTTRACSNLFNWDPLTHGDPPTRTFSNLFTWNPAPYWQAGG